MLGFTIPMDMIRISCFFLSFGFSAVLPFMLPPFSLILIPIAEPVGMGLFVVSIFIGLIMDIVVILWVAIMSGYKGIKDKKLRDKAAKRILSRTVISCFGSFIPIVDILPWATINVYSTWSAINKK